MDYTQLKTKLNGSKGDSIVKSTAVFISCLLLISMVISGLVVSPVKAQEGTNNSQCAVGPNTPGDTQEPQQSDIETMLTIDVSGSMEGNRLDESKNGSKLYVDSLKESDEVGLTSFNDRPTVEIGLTRDHTAVKVEIDDLEAGGDTDIGNGIRESKEELLTGDEASSDATKVMIVLADGSTENEQKALDEAQEAKDEGIIIYTIGVEIDAAAGDTLEEIASGEDRYYESAEASDLESVYEDISKEAEEDSEKESELTVDTRNLFNPGDTYSYTVTDDGKDITDNTSINTTDTDILSVDESSNELTATSDENTSDWVRVDATANGTEGCTNVIVSKPDVENLELLPVLWKVNATITDDTIIFILISTLAGILGTRFATSFAGLGLFDVAMIMGWFIGYVNTGIVLLTVFASLFIGLNMAANIDYTVRR